MLTLICFSFRYMETLIPAVSGPKFRGGKVSLNKPHSTQILLGLFWFIDKCCWTNVPFIVKTPAQHNLNCRWVLHENDFIPPHHPTPPRQELYSRSEKINCSVNQPNHRQLPKTILDNILDYIKQLFLTIFDYIRQTFLYKLS